MDSSGHLLNFYSVGALVFLYILNSSIRFSLLFKVCPAGGNQNPEFESFLDSSINVSRLLAAGLINRTLRQCSCQLSMTPYSQLRPAIPNFLADCT